MPRKDHAAYLAYQAEYRKNHLKEYAEWQAEFRRKHPRKRTDYQYRSLYGITLEQYEKECAEQNNLCILCGKAPRGRSIKTQRLYVDHNHKTGKRRGLICNHCNRGLGAFMDEPELLQKAIEYLKRYA